MRSSSVLPIVTLAAALAGCSGEEGSATMRPGEDCLSCHASGGQASEQVFTLAGTVYGSATAGASSGVVAGITVTDANNKVVMLTSNSAGNFYTRESLAFPVAIGVARGGAPAQMTAQSGACNGCHAQPPAGGAPGRIFVGP